MIRLPARWSTRNALYPNAYCWFLLLASLDVMVTGVVLLVYGGFEANAIAAAAIERFGVSGLLLVKLPSVLVVLAMCELIGRRREGVGRALAVSAAALTALPVLLGAAQILLWGEAESCVVEVVAAR